MPTCPNGHGEKTGRYCPDCGAELTALPARAGDSVLIRSAQATANTTVVLPGGHVETRPALVKCPKCGKRNLEPATFDCQGDCSRENLCERHFDEEHEVCVDCARTVRGITQQEAERQAKVQAELVQQREQAQQATAQIKTLQGQLTKEHADSSQFQERLQKLEQVLTLHRQQAEQASARVKELERQADKTQADHDLAWERVNALLASWRQRAEKAEGQLAAVEQARQEAEAKKQHKTEEARRRAEEAKRMQPPIWQQIGIELVRIPAGEFLYGDSRSEVNLPEYWIAKTPVTNAQYKEFVDAIRYQPPWYWTNGQIPAGKETHPVVQVTWDDAQAFCRWAGLRLPTEQEWEKAARGVVGRDYPWGNQALDAQCCNFGMNVKDTTPVGTYSADDSVYGLLDMAGNVMDWCQDWFDNEQKYRVVRGGSWNQDEKYARLAFRNWGNPDDTYRGIGFRPARSS